MILKNPRYSGENVEYLFFRKFRKKILNLPKIALIFLKKNHYKLVILRLKFWFILLVHFLSNFTEN